MSVTGIVAVDQHGAIGRGGTIPWHYSSDLRFFKEQTTGHACVMGYRTWLSLKRALPNRLNIVMSRQEEIEPQEGVILLRDKISVLSLRRYLNCDLFIIGGEQIYRTFQEEIERWIVTRVPLEVEDADTFMPSDFLAEFDVEGERELEEKLKAFIYRRRRA